MKADRIATWGALSLAAAVLVWAYAASVLSPGFVTYHDDGVYVVTARALADGHGYRIESLPDAPLQTKYPPLFPLILAVGMETVSASPAALKVIPAVFLLAWVGATCIFARRHGFSTRTAVAIAVVVAAAPHAMFFGTTLLAETLCGFLVCAGMVLLRKADVDEQSVWRDSAVCGLLFGLAFLARVAAVGLIAGALIALAVRRKWSASLAFAGAAAPCVGAWFIWVLTHRASSGEYYGAANYASWNLLSGSWSLGQAADVIGTNLLHSFVVPVTWFGVTSPAVVVLLSIALNACAVAGIVRLRSRAVTIASGVYVCVLLLWVWPPSRMLIILLPVWLTAVVAGASAASRRLYAGVLVLLLMIGVPICLHQAVEARTDGAVSLPGTRSSWHETDTCLAQATLHESAVLAGNLDPLYYLRTGRKSVRSFSADPYKLFYGTAPDALGTQEQFEVRLRQLRATHLIRHRNEIFREAAWLDQLEQSLVARGKARIASRSAGCEIYELTW